VRFVSQELIISLQQIGAFALIGAAVVLFVWGRFRYDLVALGALLAGVLIGVIPFEDAFSGFSNDVVVIIASALVVSAAISRSGVIEGLLRPILPRLKTARSQVPALVGAVGFMSMVTKNVGALAIFMPVALQLARKTNTSPSCLLMPMSFASLLGGLVTLVGTSPNILVSEVRENIVGEPFGMFDYTPVGMVVALSGFLFLCLFHKLLPAGRKGTASLDAAMESQDYVAEVVVPADYNGPATPLELHTFARRDVEVVGLLQNGERRPLLPDAPIRPGDRLLLEGEQEELERIISRLKLTLGSDREGREKTGSEVRATEAVVSRDSILVDHSAADVSLSERHGVNLVAVSRHGERISQGFKSLKLRPGDVLMLQGPSGVMPDAFRDLGLLPLAERDIRLGRRRSVKPLLVLLAAMLLVAFNVVPVAIAFFGAAVAVVAMGSLPLRGAYDALDGPVLILIAALIPVSEAIQNTGGTGLIAEALSNLVAGAPPLLALTLVMVAGMAVTPFLNNAATVLVLGPIAATLAVQLKLNPDPFLMAVAIGAACDFLTPIGHQCNTLVMGPGGYKFTDYLRLGAPLSLLVIAVGVPMIALVWPLTGG
jgi:di/tricarboxylate transporter